MEFILKSIFTLEHFYNLILKDASSGDGGDAVGKTADGKFIIIRNIQGKPTPLYVDASDMVSYASKQSVKNGGKAFNLNQDALHTITKELKVADWLVRNGRHDEAKKITDGIDAQLASMGGGKWQDYGGAHAAYDFDVQDEAQRRGVHPDEIHKERTARVQAALDAHGGHAVGSTSDPDQISGHVSSYADTILRNENVKDGDTNNPTFGYIKAFEALSRFAVDKIGNGDATPSTSNFAALIDHEIQTGEVAKHYYESALKTMEPHAAMAQANAITRGFVNLRTQLGSNSESAKFLENAFNHFASRATEAAEGNSSLASFKGQHEELGDPIGELPDNVSKQEMDAVKKYHGAATNKEQAHRQATTHAISRLAQSLSPQAQEELKRASVSEGAGNSNAIHRKGWEYGMSMVEDGMVTEEDATRLLHGALDSAAAAAHSGDQTQIIGAIKKLMHTQGIVDGINSAAEHQGVSGKARQAAWESTPGSSGDRADFQQVLWKPNANHQIPNSELRVRGGGTASAKGLGNAVQNAGQPAQPQPAAQGQSAFPTGDHADVGNHMSLFEDAAPEHQEKIKAYLNHALHHGLNVTQDQNGKKGVTIQDGNSPEFMSLINEGNGQVNVSRGTFGGGQPPSIQSLDDTPSLRSNSLSHLRYQAKDGPDHAAVAQQLTSNFKTSDLGLAHALVPGLEDGRVKANFNKSQTPDGKVTKRIELSHADNPGQALHVYSGKQGTTWHDPNSGESGRVDAKGLQAKIHEHFGLSQPKAQPAAQQPVSQLNDNVLQTPGGGSVSTGANGWPKGISSWAEPAQATPSTPAATATATAAAKTAPAPTANAQPAPSNPAQGPAAPVTAQAQGVQAQAQQGGEPDHTKTQLPPGMSQHMADRFNNIQGEASKQALMSSYRASQDLGVHDEILDSLASSHSGQVTPDLIKTVAEKLKTSDHPMYRKTGNEAADSQRAAHTAESIIHAVRMANGVPHGVQDQEGFDKWKQSYAAGTHNDAPPSDNTNTTAPTGVEGTETTHNDAGATPEQQMDHTQAGSAAAGANGAVSNTPLADTTANPSESPKRQGVMGKVFSAVKNAIGGNKQTPADIARERLIADKARRNGGATSVDSSSTPAQQVKQRLLDEGVGAERRARNEAAAKEAAQNANIDINFEDAGNSAPEAQAVAPEAQATPQSQASGQTSTPQQPETTPGQKPDTSALFGPSNASKTSPTGANFVPGLGSSLAGGKTQFTSAAGPDGINRQEVTENSGAVGKTNITDKTTIPQRMVSNSKNNQVGNYGTDKSNGSDFKVGEAAGSNMPENVNGVTPRNPAKNAGAFDGAGTDVKNQLGAEHRTVPQTPGGMLTNEGDKGFTDKNGRIGKTGVDDTRMANASANDANRMNSGNTNFGKENIIDKNQGGDKTVPQKLVEDPTSTPGSVASKFDPAGRIGKNEVGGKNVPMNNNTGQGQFTDAMGTGKTNDGTEMGRSRNVVGNNQTGVSGSDISGKTNTSRDAQLNVVDVQHMTDNLESMQDFADAEQDPTAQNRKQRQVDRERANVQAAAFEGRTSGRLNQSDLDAAEQRIADHEQAMNSTFDPNKKRQMQADLERKKGDLAKAKDSFKAGDHDSAAAHLGISAGIDVDELRGSKNEGKTFGDTSGTVLERGKLDAGKTAKGSNVVAGFKPKETDYSANTEGFKGNAPEKQEVKDEQIQAPRNTFDASQGGDIQSKVTAGQDKGILPDPTPQTLNSGNAFGGADTLEDKANADKTLTTQGAFNGTVDGKSNTSKPEQDVANEIDPSMRTLKLDRKDNTRLDFDKNIKTDKTGMTVEGPLNTAGYGKANTNRGADLGAPEMTTANEPASSDFAGIERDMPKTSFGDKGMGANTRTPSGPAWGKTDTADGKNTSGTNSPESINGQALASDQANNNGNTTLDSSMEAGKTTSGQGKDFSMTTPGMGDYDGNNVVGEDVTGSKMDAPKNAPSNLQSSGTNVAQFTGTPQIAGKTNTLNGTRAPNVDYKTPNGEAPSATVDGNNVTADVTGKAGTKNIADLGRETRKENELDGGIESAKQNLQNKEQGIVDATDRVNSRELTRDEHYQAEDALTQAHADRDTAAGQIGEAEKARADFKPNSNAAAFGNGEAGKVIPGFNPKGTKPAEEAQKETPVAAETQSATTEEPASTETAHPLDHLAGSMSPEAHQNLKDVHDAINGVDESHGNPTTSQATDKGFSVTTPNGDHHFTASEDGTIQHTTPDGQTTNVTDIEGVKNTANAFKKENGGTHTPAETAPAVEAQATPSAATQSSGGFDPSEYAEDDDDGIDDTTGSSAGVSTNGTDSSTNSGSNNPSAQTASGAPESGEQKGTKVHEALKGASYVTPEHAAALEPLNDPSIKSVKHTPSVGDDANSHGSTAIEHANGTGEVFHNKDGSLSYFDHDTAEVTPFSSADELKKHLGIQSSTPATDSSAAGEETPNKSTYSEDMYKHPTAADKMTKTQHNVLRSIHNQLTSAGITPERTTKDSHGLMFDGPGGEKFHAVSDGHGLVRITNDDGTYESSASVGRLDHATRAINKVLDGRATGKKTEGQPASQEAAPAESAPAAAEATPQEATSAPAESAPATEATPQEAGNTEASTESGVHGVPVGENYTPVNHADNVETDKNNNDTSSNENFDSYNAPHIAQAHDFMNALASVHHPDGQVIKEKPKEKKDKDGNPIPVPADHKTTSLRAEGVQGRKVRSIVNPDGSVSYQFRAASTKEGADKSITPDLSRGQADLSKLGEVAHKYLKGDISHEEMSQMIGSAKDGKHTGLKAELGDMITSGSRWNPAEHTDTTESHKGATQVASLLGDEFESTDPTSNAKGVNKSTKTYKGKGKSEATFSVKKLADGRTEYRFMDSEGTLVHDGLLVTRNGDESAADHAEIAEAARLHLNGEGVAAEEKLGEKPRHYKTAGEKEGETKISATDMTGLHAKFGDKRANIPETKTTTPKPRVQANIGSNPAPAGAVADRQPTSGAAGAPASSAPKKKPAAGKSKPAADKEESYPGHDYLESRGIEHADSHSNEDLELLGNSLDVADGYGLQHGSGKSDRTFPLKYGGKTIGRMQVKDGQVHYMDDADGQVTSFSDHNALHDHIADHIDAHEAGQSIEQFQKARKEAREAKNAQLRASGLAALRTGTAPQQPSSTTPASTQTPTASTTTPAQTGTSDATNTPGHQHLKENDLMPTGTHNAKDVSQMGKAFKTFKDEGMEVKRGKGENEYEVHHPEHGHVATVKMDGTMSITDAKSKTPSFTAFKDGGMAADHVKGMLPKPPKGDSKETTPKKTTASAPAAATTPAPAASSAAPASTEGKTTSDDTKPGSNAGKRVAGSTKNGRKAKGTDHLPATHKTYGDVLTRVIDHPDHTVSNPDSEGNIHVGMKQDDGSVKHFRVKPTSRKTKAGSKQDQAHGMEVTPVDESGKSIGETTNHPKKEQFAKALGLPVSDRARTPAEGKSDTPVGAAEKPAINHVTDESASAAGKALKDAAGSGEDGKYDLEKSKAHIDKLDAEGLAGLAKHLDVKNGSQPFHAGSAEAKKDELKARLHKKIEKNQEAPVEDKEITEAHVKGANLLFQQDSKGENGLVDFDKAKSHIDSLDTHQLASLARSLGVMNGTRPMSHSKANRDTEGVRQAVLDKVNPDQESVRQRKNSAASAGPGADVPKHFGDDHHAVFGQALHDIAQDHGSEVVEGSLNGKPYHEVTNKHGDKFHIEQNRIAGPDQKPGLKVYPMEGRARGSAITVETPKNLKAAIDTHKERAIRPAGPVGAPASEPVKAGDEAVTDAQSDDAPVSEAVEKYGHENGQFGDVDGSTPEHHKRYNATLEKLQEEGATVEPRGTDALTIEHGDKYHEVIPYDDGSVGVKTWNDFDPDDNLDEKEHDQEGDYDNEEDFAAHFGIRKSVFSTAKLLFGFRPLAPLGVTTIIKGFSPKF